MDTEELIGWFRSDVDDTDQKYLWSDEEVVRYVNDAQEEFFRLTDYAYDGITPSVTQTAVTAGDPVVVLSPKILKILMPYPYLMTSRVRVVPKRLQDMANLPMRNDYGKFGLLGSTQAGYNPTYKIGEIWESTVGTPQVLLTDFGPQRGRLVPIPVESEVLKLYVIRLPLVSITDTDSPLEIVEEHYQRALLDWIKFRAYSKQDADTQDMKRALAFQTMFNNQCRVIKQEVNRARRPSGAIRYGGL